MMLLQRRVLRLGLLQNGNVGIGVFPESEEILVGSPCLSSVSRQQVRPRQFQVRECTDGFVHNETGMIENLLELSGSSGALVHCQIRLASQVNGIKSEIQEYGRFSQFVRCRLCERLYRLTRLMSLNRGGCMDHR
jgi:hypothetical protein